jgi:hypothetical protein
MKLWILWIVTAAGHGHLERSYGQAYQTQAECERIAHMQNVLGDPASIMTWVCLPAAGSEGITLPRGQRSVEPPSVDVTVVVPK